MPLSLHPPDTCCIHIFIRLYLCIARVFIFIFMEVEALGLNRVGSEKDRLRVKRKTLEAVLQNCQRALELLGNADDCGGGNDDGDCSDSDGDAAEGSGRDKETDEVREFCVLGLFVC